MNKLFLLLLVCLSGTSHALRLQILHVNDLHSYFEGTRDGKGGYARAKHLADRLREKAKEEGMRTLFLDGGDFGEGTSFFLADRGATSLELLDALGIDATVIGNHDYLLGTDTLTDQMARSGLKAHVLSANIDERTKAKLGGQIKDLVNFDIDGVRIGVLGLTTVELHYKYALKDSATVRNPLKLVEPLEKRAREEKVDFLIALTHLGVAADRAVVKKSTDLDLVVGGHSHTRLAEPVLEKNKSGRQIPIVQTGSHSMALGEFIVDINPETGGHELVSYTLHEITRDLPEDEEVARLVQKAREARDAFTGRPFDEVIGETTVDLSGYVNGKNPGVTSCWGSHLARMTREAAAADVGLHIANFEGELIPKGPIRYGDILDSFPHFRAYGDPGWEIVTVKMRGFYLKAILDVVSKKPGSFGMNLSGIEKVDGRYRIGGKKLNLFENYTLALPAEITLAIETTLPFTRRLIYKDRRKTNVFYWPAMEDYIRANSPLGCAEPR